MDPNELWICVQPDCRIFPLLLETERLKQSHLQQDHRIESIQDIRQLLFREKLSQEGKLNRAFHMMKEVLFKTQELLGCSSLGLQGFQDIYDNLVLPLELAQSRQFLIKLYCYVFDKYPKKLFNELGGLLNELQNRNEDASFLIQDGLGIPEQYLQLYKSLLTNEKINQKLQGTYAIPQRGGNFQLKTYYRDKEDENSYVDLTPLSNMKLNNFIGIFSLEDIGFVIHPNQTKCFQKNIQLPTKIMRFQTDKDFKHGNLNSISHSLQHFKTLVSLTLNLITTDQCQQYPCPMFANPVQLPQLKSLKLKCYPGNNCWIKFLSQVQQLEELYVQYHIQQSNQIFCDTGYQSGTTFSHNLNQFSNQNLFGNQNNSRSKQEYQLFLQSCQNIRLKKLTMINANWFQGNIFKDGRCFNYLTELTISNLYHQFIIKGFNLPQLRKLWLNLIQVDQEIFEDLQQDTDLESINITVYQGVSDAWIQKLSGLPKLNRFVFQSLNSAQEVINLSEFKKLKSLSLNVGYLPRVDFSPLQDLEELNLSIRNRCSGDLSKLEKNLNLRRLLLEIENFEENVILPKFEILTSLRSLHFHTYDNYWFRNAKVFDPKNLFVQDKNYSIDLNAFKSLTQLKSLQKLTLKFANQIDIDSVKELSQIQKCQIKINSSNYKFEKKVKQ